MNISAHFCTYTPYAFFEEDAKTLLCYQGPFSMSIISRMGQDLRQDTATYGYISWKLFAIFIELAQNVHFHAVERNVTSQPETMPVGLVMVEDLNHTFEITTANIIPIESIQKIQARCEAVNKLSLSELRKYKNELLSTAVDENLSGGNIGLVQVVLLSQEKIQYDLVPINEEIAFFTLTTTIKKEKQ